jgi:hypothetical protein
MYFMNEMEVDEAIAWHARGERSILSRGERTPITALAANYLGAYRDIVNQHSDGWPYWGSDKATDLMKLVQGEVPATQANLERAVRRIKSFCLKRGLPLPHEPERHAAPSATVSAGQIELTLGLAS